MNQQPSILISRSKPFLAVLLLATTPMFAEDFSADATFDGVVTNTSHIHIGFSVPDVTITITNGAQVINTGGLGRTQIGYPNTASSNAAVIVTGSGSLLTNTGNMTVGRLSEGNRLLIEDGGDVRSGAGFLGGQDGDEGAGPSNNVAIVTGSGSQWINVDSFTIGRTAGGNSVFVSNGADIISARTTLGDFGVAGGNQLIITGAGSTLSNTISAGLDGLIVGLNAQNNQVIISDGARLDTYFAVVGYSSTASGNSMLITGAGSVLRANAELEIGRDSSGNQVIISNGAQVFCVLNSNIGWGPGTSNRLVVTGAGSFYDVGAALSVGRTGGNNHMRIEDGAVVESGTGFLSGRDGDEGTANSNNTATVTGSGSTWRILDELNVGRTSGGNQLVITNGGLVQNTFSYVGRAAAAANNTVLVTGSGSVWTNSAEINIGYVGASNRLIVADGGKVFGTRLDVGAIASTATDNSVTVTGSDALIRLSGEFRIGVAGQGNSAIVTNGGQIVNASNINLGFTSNNTLVVTGNGSMVSNNSTLTVGRIGQANRMTIENGGVVRTAAGFMGGRDGDEGPGASNNVATVTGNGSAWINSSALTVGRTGGDNRLIITNGGLVHSAGTVNVGDSIVGNNSIRVVNNGVLETATGFTAGSAAGNSISNVNGVYQFTIATPTITPNGAGRIAITDGTISYRDVSAANIFNSQVANISFAGDNTFRLNNSSNSSIASYTFNTGLGATNYHRLELVNGTTRWATTGGTTIGAGGSVLTSNTMATIAGTLTIHGSYVSDPSTNTFLADVTVGQSGTMAGGAGDLFDFKQSLFIHSTNQSGFNLANSAVQFSGGGLHTNAITGEDLGGGVIAWEAAFSHETNFAYGELHLGSASDQICFTCGNIPTVASNGLYIGWLDLLGNAGLVTNLHADSGITLYYDATDTRNAYLAGMTYALTDCDFELGGGFLAPVIPEPGVLSLIVISALAMMRRKRP